LNFFFLAKSSDFALAGPALAVFAPDIPQINAKKRNKEANFVIIVTFS
jgi:hypothetical protein